MKDSSSGRRSDRRRGIAAATALILLSMLLLLLPLSGCGGQPVIVTGPATATSPTGGTTTTGYTRMQIDYFRGITEPRSDAWQDLADDANHVRADNINTVTIDPPVLLSQRAGGKARIALEGAAGLAPGVIDELHRSGLAVHLAPTSSIPGFTPEIEPTDANLSALDDETLRWARTAEDKQVELFSPLDRYNLVLGTGAADRWSAAILPRIRERYHGPLAAMVVPDLTGTPPAGSPHDFEKLSYKGYDYLIIDIIPHQTPFDETAFLKTTADILARAKTVMQRDGLAGIMIRCGSWREQAGIDVLDGPELGEQGQADLTSLVLNQAIPQLMPEVKGVFFEGWTLPGRGARDFAVEPVLNNFFSTAKAGR